MFCPNCKAKLHTVAIELVEANDSELEVIWPCYECGEAFTVCIAQEDLSPPKRTYTIMEKFLKHAKRLPW